jgi:aerobic-type carbon monoxide dehydrogenase small subunit (CoxS/CutS family)
MSQLPRQEIALRAKKIPIAKQSVNLVVNGQPYKLDIGDQPGEVGPSHTLAHTLRETLGLTGTKVGCDHGACGACFPTPY